MSKIPSNKNRRHRKVFSGTVKPLKSTVHKDYDLQNGMILGSGAEGVVKKVYGALDKKKERPVAIKIVDTTNLDLE